MFQASACGEYISMDSQDRTRGLCCWFVFPWVVIDRNMWGHSC